jgi:hypothetical protein
MKLKKEKTHSLKIKKKVSLSHIQCWDRKSEEGNQIENKDTERWR